MHKLLSALAIVSFLLGCGGQPKEDAEVPSESPSSPETPVEDPAPAPPPPPPRYSVGGSVQGLRHGSLTLRMNNSEVVTVQATQNTFTFSTQLESGEAYAVEVLQSQVNPSVTCTLTNGSGQIASSPVTNLLVSCPEPLSIQVSTPSLQMMVGSRQNVSLHALYSDGTIQNLMGFVPITSTDLGVITLASATQVEAVNAGQAQIHAEFLGLQSSVPLQAIAGNLTSLSIQPFGLNLSVGEVRALSVTGIYDTGFTQNLTPQVSWSIANPTVASLSASGRLEALQAGTSTISASFGAITQSIGLVVNSATLQSLQLSPVLFVGAAGSARQYSLMGIYSDGKSRDLTNLISLSAVPSQTVSLSPAQPGWVQFLSAGTVTLSAAVGGLQAQSVAQISGASLSTISLSPQAVTIASGFSVRATATGYYTDGSSLDITDNVVWTSSAPSVAQVSSTGDTKGLVTGISAGASVITASLSGRLATFQTVVSNASLTSLRTEPEEILISKGINVPFRAYGTFSDGAELDVTSFALWSSSNSTIAVMSNGDSDKGLMNNVYSGTATQFLTVRASLSGLSASADVIVTPATLSALRLDPIDVTMSALSSLQLRAIGNFSDGASEDLTKIVTWTTSDVNRAGVENTFREAGRLSALQEGSVTVSASVAGVTGTLPVRIDNTLTPAHTVLGNGLTGYYFNERNFNPLDLRGSRTDAIINYNWGTGTAPLGVGDRFSIRFVGEVQAVYSETYTFCMRSDDGIRLYVNSVPLVLNWTDHAAREDCGSIALVAGQRYPIRIEFYENGGHSVVEMRWQSASQPKVVVPQRYLFTVD